MLKKATILFVLTAFLICKSAFGQITIAPIMLFMDDQNRFGTLLILNGSDQAQEISIDFPFGYPTTDAEGGIKMVYDDGASADKFGISNDIRGFPRSFVLQPGQRQVVRLTVRPEKTEAGMYWTRARITSIPQAPPIGEVSEESITAQITYKFEQVTTIFYKHGAVTTGLNMINLSVEQPGDAIKLISDVQRTGNAPFLGSIILTISNSTGDILVQKKSSTSVYFDFRQVFSIDKNELSAGNYTAQIKYISERPDIPGPDLVQTEPLTQSVNFTVK